MDDRASGFPPGTRAPCASIAAHAAEVSMVRQRLCYLGILLAAAGLAPAQQQDFSKVEIRTTRLAEGLYVLQGAGGNMTASVGADGVLLVDSEYAALADKIRAALRGLGGGGTGSAGGSSPGGDQPGSGARREP